ncbi:hypothetical protein D9M72_373440 [compost metagenome]
MRGEGRFCGVGSAEEPQRRTGQAHVPQDLVVDVDHQALRMHLLPGVHLVQGADLAGRDAGGVEFGEQLPGFVIGECLLHLFDDFLAVAHPVRVAGEFGTRCVDSERGSERFPQFFAAHADLDPSLPAVEQSVGSDGGVVVALRLRDLAGNSRPGALECVHADKSGQQRGADDLPLPGPLALQQRRQGPERAIHAREKIGDGDTHPLGVVRSRTGQGHQAGFALQDLVVAAAPGFRPVVSEAGDGQDHQCRVQRVHFRGGEAQPVQDAGAEVLDDDVGAFQQFAQDCPPVVVLQIQSDGFLVPVAGQKIGRLRIVLRADEGRAPAARVVPGAGVLHLDDAGAEVGKHHACVRACQGAAQVHHEVARQGTLCLGSGFSALHGVPSLLLGAWVAAVAGRPTTSPVPP